MDQVCRVDPAKGPQNTTSVSYGPLVGGFLTLWAVLLPPLPTEPYEDRRAGCSVGPALESRCRASDLTEPAARCLSLRERHLSKRRVCVASRIDLYGMSEIRRVVGRNEPHGV